MCKMLTWLLCAVFTSPAPADALSQNVDRELRILRSFTDIDDTELDKLRKQTQSPLDRIWFTDKLEYAFGHIPPAVYDRLLKAARKQLGENEKLVEYERDLEARRELRRKATAGQFMLQIHRAIGVRSDQWDKTQAAVNELARDGAIPHLFTQANPARKAKINRSLKEIVTKEQYKLWKSNSGLTKKAVFVMSEFEGDVEPRKKKLKAELHSIAAARSAWLRDEFRLTAKQNRRLELAAKGAISGLVEKRIAAEEAYSRMTDQPLAIDFFSKEVRLALLDQTTLLSRHGRWRSLMLSVLDDDQKAAFLKLEKQRNTFARTVKIDQAVFSLTRKFPLTADQLKKYRALLERVIPQIDPTSPRASLEVSKLLDIDERLLNEILGEDVWEAHRQELAELRERQKQRWGN